MGCYVDYWEPESCLMSTTVDFCSLDFPVLRKELLIRLILLLMSGLEKEQTS